MLDFILNFLNRNPWILRIVMRIRWLRRLISDIYINLQAYSAPPRPRPYSMAQSYTTWRSLTDRTYTGRHLPPIETPHELPDINQVTELWRRKNGKEIPSADTSMLFSFFAQWFTDSFLRTDLLDRRKNTSNHEIDLCQIYGLSEDITNRLRLKQDGKLKHQFIDGEMFPAYLFDPDKTTTDNWVFANEEFENLHPRHALQFIFNGVPEERLKYMFAVGLEHGNSAIGYTVLNTIMLREHNRICDLIGAAHPDWDDERIFQTTRNTMVVLLINIVLGDYIGQFSQLEFTLDPTPGKAEKQQWYRTNWIALEFNLLYRWHSMVPDSFALGDEKLPIDEFRSNVPWVIKHGVDSVIRAATMQRAGQIGLRNTPDVFFEPLPFAGDNRSVMQRTVAMARQAKLASFNDYREAFSMRRLRSFAELTDDVELREDLSRLYNGRIDDLEWLVGIFAERGDATFMLGRLMSRMVGYDAFTHALTNPLMSTQVHNEKTFSKTGLAVIESTQSITDIIQRNVKGGDAVPASFNTAEGSLPGPQAHSATAAGLMNKLPQFEKDARGSQHRKDYLHRMQERYQYIYEFANTIAVARKLPWQEFPGLRYWIAGGLNIVRLLPSVPNVARTVVRYLLGQPLRSYQEFVFYPRSPRPNPELVDNFQDDGVFGLQRVIGVNPVVLRAVTDAQPLPDKLPVAKAKAMFAEQVSELSFAKAIKDKRLYVLDYAELAILQQNPGQIDGGRKQHITTPIVLLYQQTDGTLRPIAIALHQTSSDDRVYSANDGNLWRAAKTFAQIADGNHHILYTHATRIHYVMEAIIMASRRQLYKTHPLYVLLSPHLQFTLNVNHQHTFLRNRKGRPGRFGKLFAGDYDATMQCMADSMVSFNFADSAFPVDIANRAVDNPDLFYPYRDDGKLLWDAIQQFSKDYIDIYYASDGDVAADTELAAWANDIGAQDRGRIQGFPTAIVSKAVLSETVGHIIFLCTAHHSCIHFNQYAFPGFVPNMPYASYTPPPSGTEQDIDKAALFAMQPAFRAANTQTWTYFLTNFRANRIGQYPLRRFDNPARQVIADFNRRLDEIEKEIARRNDTRPVRYDRLKPSSIPNSVSV